ncbi:MAG TPA: DUF1778 domain-containing protein [Marinobacter sp.]|nr:DUF1778 domain-containing protein [Marinobacter sp.]
MLASTTLKNSSEAGKRNTARFNFRTTEHVKQTVERAAAMTGQDVSAFAIDAIYQRAIATIQAHEVTHLKVQDHHAFFDALENPAVPTDKLRAAFAQHHQRVVKR